MEMSEVVAKVRQFPPNQQEEVQRVARDWAITENRLAEWEKFFPPATPEPSAVNPEVGTIDHLLRGVAFFSKEFGFGLTPVEGIQAPRVNVLRFSPELKTDVTMVARKFPNITARLKGIGASPPPIVRVIDGGIEVLCVRKNWDVCHLSQYVKSKPWQPWEKFTLPLSVSIDGNLIEPSLVHMQVAGTPGSGKTALLNALLGSVLIRYKPEQVQWLLIDPERVGLRQFNGLAWFWRGLDGRMPKKAIVDTAESVEAIRSVLDEHQRRLRLLELEGVDCLERYNRKNPSTLPHLMVIIDEYGVFLGRVGEAVVPPAEEGQKPKSAGAIDTEGRKILNDLVIDIGRICRKTGIHLIVASQRAAQDTFDPNLRDVLEIKIVLKCASQGGSQVAFGYNCDWAVQLAGNGDMWVVDGGEAQRGQGLYIDDDTVLSDGLTRLGRLLAAARLVKDPGT